MVSFASQIGRRPGGPIANQPVEFGSWKARLKLNTDCRFLSGLTPIASPVPTLEHRRQRSLQLALAAARTADENRGQDIAVLDMRGMTPEFDYFVLATGNSRRQLHAISEEIDRTLESELGDHRLGIEGYSESRWILLDYGSVVIHLFDAETRDFYALEDLWSTAERIPLPWKKETHKEEGGGMTNSE